MVVRSRQMSSARRRVARERQTIEAMIALFCRDQHGSPQTLCGECARLWAYAQQRLDKCPYGENKPTCVKCPIHCYKPAAREQVKAVMRYAGPRMLLRRPILAIRHMLDERKPLPPQPRRNSGKSAKERESTGAGA